jgi:hypothetical protein
LREKAGANMAPGVECSGWRDVLCQLPTLLGHEAEWMISGSCAMVWHGLTIEPNDIDVWCMPDHLKHLADRCGERVSQHQKAALSLESFEINVSGWRVEIVGRVYKEGGILMSVDRDMLMEARGHPLVESVEDLVAELLVLDRSSPKFDFRRAVTLSKAQRDGLRTQYVRTRLRRFGVTPSEVEYKLDLLLAQLAAQP